MILTMTVMILLLMMMMLLVTWLRYHKKGRPFCDLSPKPSSRL